VWGSISPALLPSPLPSAYMDVRAAAEVASRWRVAIAALRADPDHAAPAFEAASSRCP
jgi:hypothetical protein